MAFLQTDLIPKIPLDVWTESAVEWITETFEWFFEPLDAAIDVVVGSLEFILLTPPALLTVAVLGAIAFSWRAGV